MIGLLILVGLCYYGAYFYYKKRKFYRNNSHEVQGEVVFFEKRRGWKGQKGWPYYLIKVTAAGQDYLIETDNSKARKYAKRTDITLLVPETLENPLSAGMLAKYSAQAVTPEERSQVEELYVRSAEIEREIDDVNTHMRTNLAIIKEDLPSAGAFWFLLIFGTLLLVGAVVSVAAELMRK